MTFEQAVIHLGSRDFSAGLTFVAISRVKSLAFRPVFEEQRILGPKRSAARPGGQDTMRQSARLDEERRGRLGLIDGVERTPDNENRREIFDRDIRNT